MMCAARGMHGAVTGARRFLFEILPDLFWQGYYTELEDAIWARFLEDESERMRRDG